MNLNAIASYIVWGILIAESIVGLALLFSGVIIRITESRTTRQAAKQTDKYLKNINAIRLTGEKRRIAVRALKADTTSDSTFIGRLVDHMLARGTRLSDIQTLIELQISKTERGADRVCSFIARTAPLAGLAGTLIGVQAALSAFSADRADPNHVISGFATAVQTTLAGIFVAFMCLATSRLLFEPRLKKTAIEIFEMAMRLRASILAVVTPTQDKPGHNTRSGHTHRIAPVPGGHGSDQPSTLRRPDSGCTCSSSIPAPGDRSNLTRPVISQHQSDHGSPEQEVINHVESI
jgi:biopolymer transport protein ExbB/TolQ